VYSQPGRPSNSHGCVLGAPFNLPFSISHGTLEEAIFSDELDSRISVVSELQEVIIEKKRKEIFHVV